MKRRRPMRIKRLRKDMVYIGTWNVMTMLKAGKMNKRPSETQVQMGRRHQKRSEKAGSGKTVRPGPR